jgi:hypothetical protein
MPLLAVALDLRSEQGSFNYEPLVRDLARLSAVRVQKSLYLLEAKRTPREIVDQLGRFLEPGDGLIVFETYAKPWCNHMVRGAEKWLAEAPARVSG